MKRILKVTLSPMSRPENSARPLSRMILSSDSFSALRADSLLPVNQGSSK